jgi:hypothetical protein
VLVDKRWQMKFWIMMELLWKLGKSIWRIFEDELLRERSPTGRVTQPWEEWHGSVPLSVRGYTKYQWEISLSYAPSNSFVHQDAVKRWLVRHDENSQRREETRSCNDKRFEEQKRRQDKKKIQHEEWMKY